jgi:hypothetical protein
MQAPSEDADDALVEQALSMLDREYQRCLAASADRAPALEAEELAEATEAAEAAGYGSIGSCVAYSDEDSEEGEEGAPHGYAAFQNDSDDDDGGDGMQAASSAPDEEDGPAAAAAAIATAAAAAPSAAAAAATAAADRVTSEQHGSCAPLPILGTSPPLTVAADDASSSGWTATFPEISIDAGAVDGAHTAGAVEVSDGASAPAPPLSPPPLPVAAPLPPERVATIKQVMAGLSLAPPPPAWASTVPESVWMHEILRRDAPTSGGGGGGRGRGRGRGGGGGSGRGGSDGQKSRAGRGRADDTGGPASPAAAP